MIPRSIKELLPPGITVMAHWMPWFGTSSHMDIGYDCTNPLVIVRTVARMKEIGIDCVVPDWYGQDNTHHDQASLMMLAECEKQGLTFALCLDAGAIKGKADPQAEFVRELSYASLKYYPSSSYLKHNGRPLILFFGDSSYPTVNWNTVRNSIADNPQFIFRNRIGFLHAQSDGAFSWIGLSSDPNNPGLSMLNAFYTEAAKFPKKIAIGSIYPGFDDSNASWGQGRKMNRRAGQTFYDTCSIVPVTGVPYIQIVTFNDHEESSGIEFSITDNIFRYFPNK